MQITELYFNPKHKNKICKYFFHKPCFSEKGLGRLYMIGETNNPTKTKMSLLENIFCVAEKNYYHDCSLSPTTALEKTLKKVNDFIRDQELYEEMDIAIFSFKNFNFHLGKTGKLKSIIIKNNTITDLGSEFISYHPGLFHNIVSGKIRKKEQLVLMSAEVYSLIEKEKILTTNKSDSIGLIDKISNIDKSKFSHICGMIFIANNITTDKNKLVCEKKKDFSFSEIINSVINISFLRNMKEFFFNLRYLIINKRLLTLFFSLLIIMFLGVLTTIIIHNDADNGKKHQQIEDIKENIIQAKEENNISLLIDSERALNKIKDSELNKETIAFINKTTKDLFSLFYGEHVEEFVFVGKINKINPQWIINHGNDIYAFSETDSAMSIINKKTGEETLIILPELENKKIDMIAYYNDMIFLFSQPDNLFYFDTGRVYPYPINDLDNNTSDILSIDSFLDRPYFLDSSGRVIFYHDKNQNPYSWIKKGNEPQNQISMAIDGHIFILSSMGEIYSYYKGEKIKTFIPVIFPTLSNANEIYTNPKSPLFITDPLNSRIVIIEKKEEESIKQIHHSDLSSIRHMTIDDSGKKIYLLINEKVYYYKNI